MAEDAVGTRVATVADLEAMVATLAESHDGYAWERWAMPGADAALLSDLYRIDLDLIALPHGAVHVVTHGAAEVASVAAWIPTGVFGRLADEVLEALDAAATAAIGDRLALVDEVEREIRAVRPHADWYLATMGTRPALQGRGLGAAALRPMLDRLDRESATAVLETSDERNIAFYRRAGFEVAHHLDALPHAAPPVWVMHRTPRVHVASDTT